MNKFTNNDKEIIIKSLCHLYVVSKLNENNTNYEEFMKDKVKLDSSIFHLTQVGELCTKYTSDFRESHTNVNFRDIIGLRNVMVHGYGTLHYDDIFSIIKDDVPQLMKEYKIILKENYNVTDVDSYLINYYNTRKFDSVEN